MSLDFYGELMGLIEELAIHGVARATADIADIRRLEELDR